MLESLERFGIPSGIDEDHGHKQPRFGCPGLQLQCALQAAQSLFLVLELLVFLQSELDPSSRVIGLVFHLQTKQVAVIGALVSLVGAAFQMTKMMNKEVRHAYLEAGGGDLRFDQLVDAPGEVDVGTPAE